MKLKKIISALTVSAVVATALPVYSGISALAFADDETGNNMLTAIDMSFDEVISGQITSTSTAEQKWYKFTVPTAGKINMTFVADASYCNFDIIDVYDDNNVIISEGISEVMTTGTHNFTYYLNAGDYYINIKNGHLRSGYNVKLTFTPYNLTFDGVNNNSINKASEIELETNYSAHIANNDSKDYYTFNLAEDDDIALNFEGDINSIDWILYNNKDEEILNGTYTRNNKISDFIVSNNYISLKSGKYTLAFNSNYNYGTYNFSLSKYVDFEANGISMADFNDDGKIDASDATVLLEYYSYVSTGGEEKDMRNWLEEKK